MVVPVTLEGTSTIAFHLPPPGRFRRTPGGSSSDVARTNEAVGAEDNGTLLPHIVRRGNRPQITR